MGSSCNSNMGRYQLGSSSNKKEIKAGEQQQQKEISAREQKQQQKSRNDILSGEQKLYWQGGYIS